MKKLLVAAFLAIALVFTGCAGLGLDNLPSKCDVLTERSVLCELADKAGVRLEDVGNVLIVANTVAIGEGLYTKAQAQEVFKGIVRLLGGPDPDTRAFITYAELRDGIMKLVNKYPGLFLIAESYLDMFMQKQEFITEWDKKTLVNFFSNAADAMERDLAKNYGM